MKTFVFSLVLSAATAAAAAMLEMELHAVVPGTPAHAAEIHRRVEKNWYEYDMFLEFNHSDGGLLASVYVGTPSQLLSLVVDTGSADTWVVSSDADRCTAAETEKQGMELCDTPFTPSKSSTFRLLDNDGFDISYNEMSATGATFIDDVTIAGARVTGLQMGLGREVPAAADPLGNAGLQVKDTVMGSVGVLGLGFPEAEAGADSDGTNLHPTLVDLLHAQGYINMRAYSLGLYPRGQYPEGALVFGKADFGKFDGPLVPLSALRTFQINNETTSWPYIAPAVALASLEVLPDGTDGNSNKTTPIALPDNPDGYIAATLETSRVLSHMPEHIATPLFEAVGAYVSPAGYAYVECASTAAVRLVFGTAEANVTVVVKAELLALDVIADMASDSFPFSRACLLAIQNLDAEHGPDVPAYTFARLGTAVLRALYMVVSFEHHQVGVAQSAYGPQYYKALPANATSLPTDWVSHDGFPVDPAAKVPMSRPSAAGAARPPVFAALTCLLLSFVFV